MNTVSHSNSALLKEMGISEWISRDAIEPPPAEVP